MPNFRLSILFLCFQQNIAIIEHVFYNDMERKSDYDPNKVANVALIIVGGVSFFVSLAIITGG